jgi:hypothetical protein
MNGRRRIANGFNGAAVRGNPRKFDSIHHQADELVHPPALLVEDVEGFLRNRL